MNSTNKMHDVHLPFTEEQVARHFPDIKRDEQVAYFRNSLNNYKVWEDNPDLERKQYATKRQAEKDERFWTARHFIGLFEAEDTALKLENLLKKAFGDEPPFKNGETWAELLKGDLKLVLECSFPAPMGYKDDLKDTMPQHHIIDYVLEKARVKAKPGDNQDEQPWRGDLEGATQVDAFIVNMTTGFNMVCEAKLISDISYDTTYNMARNQIARNIDVMLDKKTVKDHPELNARDINKSLFLLVTPAFFKKNPHTRLYGYKMADYKNNPDTLQKDLHYRTENWPALSQRLGWITWEEIKKVVK